MDSRTPLALFRENLIEANLQILPVHDMHPTTPLTPRHDAAIRFAGALMMCAALCGCPWTTRYPNLQQVEHPEASRQVSQTQDPFPDSHLGPQTGFRPLGYGQQRAEEQIAKSRNYASWLRIQAHPPQTIPQYPGLPSGYLPPAGPIPAASYPVPPYPAMAYPPGPGMYPLGVPYPAPYYATPAPAVR